MAFKGVIFPTFSAEFADSGNQILPDLQLPNVRPTCILHKKYKRADHSMWWS